MCYYKGAVIPSDALSFSPPSLYPATRRFLFFSAVRNGKSTPAGASFRSLLHKRALLIPTGITCAPFVQNQTKLHRPQAHFCRFRPASSFYFLPQSFSPLAFAQTRLANTNKDCLRPVCAKSNEITSPAGALLPIPHRLNFFSCRSSFRTPPHEDTSLPDALLPIPHRLIFLILVACRRAPFRFLLHKHIAQNGSTLINVINTFMVFPLSESFFL